MMYGPQAGTRIRDELAALASKVESPDLRKKQEKYGYSTGSGKHFGVKQFDLRSHQERLKANHYNLASVLMDQRTGMPVTDNPRFVWIDRSPSWSDALDSQKPVMPTVAIEVKNEDGWLPLSIDGLPENDDGLDIVTTIVASLFGNTRWTTIWMTPSSVKRHAMLSQAEFRFVVQGTSGTFRSPGFNLESAYSRSGLTGIAREPEQSSMIQ